MKNSQVYPLEVLLAEMPAKIPAMSVDDRPWMQKPAPVVLATPPADGVDGSAEEKTPGIQETTGSVFG